jgi:hypothetical protein
VLAASGTPAASTSEHSGGTGATSPASTTANSAYSACTGGKRRHGHNPIADEGPLGPLADLVDETGHVVPEDARRCETGPGPIDPVAGINGVQTGGVNGDAQATWWSDGVGDLRQAEDVRATEPLRQDSLQTPSDGRVIVRREPTLNAGLLT